MAEQLRPGAAAPRPASAEEDYDKALRPTRLGEFIGQQKIKDNLQVFLTAALQRGEVLDHVLLSGPPGLGKCITPDSLVLTRGGLVPFSDVLPPGMKPGESRPVAVDVFGTDGLERASHVYYSGRVATRRIRTRAGFELEGTPHHPLLVATPDGPTWKTLAELSADDAVAVSRGSRVQGQVHTCDWIPQGNAARRHRVEHLVRHLHGVLSRHLRRPPAAVELRRAYASTAGHDSPSVQRAAQRLGLPLSDGRRVPTASRLPPVPLPDRARTVALDADLAYLLGLLVGDGHAEADGGFVLTCTEPEIQQQARRIAERAFGRSVHVRAYGGKAPRIAFGADMGAAFRAFGLSRAGAAAKQVPAAVMTSAPDVVAAFVQGLFDADGHARADGVEFGTRSALLARQVQLLLAGLGIIAYRRQAEKAGAPFHTLFIGGDDAARYYRTVGFRLTRKQALRAAMPVRRGPGRSDTIPGAGRLLAGLLRATGPHPRALHKQFGHAVREDRTLTRQQATRLLGLLPLTAAQHPAYAGLAVLLDPRFAWDRVVENVPSENDAYDFVVPGTHSFVAGGLVNHNTTLAFIIAEEMGAQVKTTSGPVLDKPATIAGLLTNLGEGDVLFIDEIHRMPAVVEEYLYSAMEDYRIDIMIDSGPNARSVKIQLPPFTLVGATTRKGLLTAPMRARFGIDFRYDYYSADLLQQIVERSAALSRVEIDAEGAYEIARRSRGTPRIANRLLRRTRDFAEVQSDGRITRAIADGALNALDVDERGFDDMDTRILLTIIEKFGGGPTGLGNLAVSVGEDAGTLEEVYEPYLIQEGFLERTSRGRVATLRAYEHFGLAPPPKTADLFGL